MLSCIYVIGILTNTAEKLASTRPTKPVARNLAEAFKLGNPDYASPLDLSLDHFKRALEFEKKALHKLNDLSSKAADIKNDVFKNLKAYIKTHELGLSIARLVGQKADPELAKSYDLKYLVSKADKSVVEVPSYLNRNPESIFENAELLNDLHTDVLQNSQELNLLQANGNILDDYPNIEKRLDEFKHLATDSETQYIIEYLEKRIAGLSDKRALKNRLNDFIDENIVDQVARAALYYGIPLDLSLDLVKHFIPQKSHEPFVQYNPFEPIPVIDPKLDSSILKKYKSELDEQVSSDLQPSQHIFGMNTPIDTMDAIRMAMKENYPNLNPRSPQSVFIQSLRNIDEIQNAHYNHKDVPAMLREPHFMGIGSWGELRAGIALIKVQDQHEKTYLHQIKDPKEGEPIIITQVIPCADKKYYDNAGVDFWIKVIDRETKKESYIPVQIKNSQTGVDKHKDTGFKHPCFSLTKTHPRGYTVGKTLSQLSNEMRKEIPKSQIRLSKEEFERINTEFKNTSDIRSRNNKSLVSKLRGYLKGNRVRI